MSTAMADIDPIEAARAERRAAVQRDPQLAEIAAAFHALPPRPARRIERAAQRAGVDPAALPNLGFD